MKLFQNSPDAKASKSDSDALPVNVPATVARVSDETRRKQRIYFRSVSSAAFVLVCAGRESQLTTAAELAALRDAQSCWRTFQDQIDSIGHDAAKKQVKAAREAYLSDPDEGSFEVLRDAELDKASLNEHFARLREAVKVAMAEHCRATNPLALPVLARALAMVEAESASLQTIESKAAERYGVPFAPSPTLAGLDALCVTIENTLYDTANNLRGRVGVRALLGGILKL